MQPNLVQNSQKQVPTTLYSKQLVDALDAIMDAVLSDDAGVVERTSEADKVAAKKGLTFIKIPITEIAGHSIFAKS